MPSHQSFDTQKVNQSTVGFVKTAFLTIVLVAHASMAQAQLTKEQQASPLSTEKLLPDFNSLSPEAASLGRYGSHQVSEYTGTPNIRIPLFEVKSGDVSYPVELYYDASGIKVAQEATFVGLGWNLSYGGSISHIVCGYDDYLEYPNNPQSYFDKTIYVSSIGTPFYTGYTTNMGILGYEGQVTQCLPTSEPEKYLFFNDLSKGYYVPDIFQASFCGQTVMFCIDKTDGKARVLNDLQNKYKIEYTNGDVYPSSFTITNDRGVSYQFDAFKEGDKKDSYYLTCIYGMDGKSGRSAVEFLYSQKYLDYGKSGLNLVEQMTDAKFVEGTYPNELSSQVNDLVRQHTTYQYLSHSPGGLYNKVYPSKIITRQGSVEFELISRADLIDGQAIGGIRVSSPTGELQDNISLTYGYFEESNPAQGTTGKRLMLKGVSVNSRKYAMSYDGSPALPSAKSQSRDFWGYCNGVDNGKLQCASPKYVLGGDTVKTIEHLGDANRFASEKKCMAGMLTSITYPTGGSSHFEYEANRFTDRYFYPGVEEKFNKNKVDYRVDVYGQGAYQHQTKTFTLDGEKTLYFCAMLFTPDASRFAATMSLTNASTGEVLQSASTPKGTGEQHYENTTYITLGPGTYVLEASVPQCNESRIPVAQCEVSYETVTTGSLSNVSRGGVSVGGGVRIKGIRNYDSSGNMLCGVLYEYKDGKLLTPTAMLERHFVDFSYYGKGEEKLVNFSFNYISPEPSYAYVCSIGVPATVGYSQVVKKETDKDGNAVKTTVLYYNNNGYEIDRNINERTNNALFYNKDGHLNGKLKCQTVSSADGKMVYQATYEYGKTQLGDVIFSKCLPTFLPGAVLAEVKYDVALLRKRMDWSYPTKTDETYYVDGKVGETRTTTYSYNPNNLQTSKLTVSNASGGQSSWINYWYPSDGKSVGVSNLVERHCLGELSGFEKYEDGTLASGIRFDYTTHNGVPVVSKSYSIAPDGKDTQELVVDSYDEQGNILQYTEQDGTPVTLLWSYNYQCPVMRIGGATYQQAKALSNQVTGLGGKTSLTKDALQSIHNAALGLSYQTTSYFYDTRLNLTQILHPNGLETHYEYDSDGRLTKTDDPFGTLQNFGYNYKLK